MGGRRRAACLREGGRQIRLLCCPSLIAGLSACLSCRPMTSWQATMARIPHSVDDEPEIMAKLAAAYFLGR